MSFSQSSKLASPRFLHNLAGDNSEEATPDPIPNSEVKLFSVDGTAWVTMWESRSLPAFFCFCAASASSRRRSRAKHASLLAPSIHTRKNKKRYFFRFGRASASSPTKKSASYVRSTRLADFFLAPSICSDKIEKRLSIVFY